VVSLATDNQARALVVVVTPEIEPVYPAYRALSFIRQGSGYVCRNSRDFDAQNVPFLAPIAISNNEMMLAMWNGWEISFLSLPDLLKVGRMAEQPLFRAMLLLDGWKLTKMSASTLVLAGHRIFFEISDTQRDLHLSHLMMSALSQDGPPMFSWLAPQRTNVEVVFVDTEGSLHWLVLRVLTDDPAVLFDQRASSVFRCATLLKPGKAAAVHRDRVVWLGRTDRTVTARTQTPLGLSDAVACFASPVTNELLVVAAEGDVIRVSVPG
jgi:hypothetical protein